MEGLGLHEENKEADQAINLKNFASRGGAESGSSAPPSKPKVNFMRNSLLFTAKEDSN